MTGTGGVSASSKPAPSVLLRWHSILVSLGAGGDSGPDLPAAQAASESVTPRIPAAAAAGPGDAQDLIIIIIP